MNYELRIKLLVLMLVAMSTAASAQVLKAYRGKIAGGYNFWFYIPPEEDVQRANSGVALSVSARRPSAGGGGDFVLSHPSRESTEYRSDGTRQSVGKSVDGTRRSESEQQSADMADRKLRLPGMVSGPSRSAARVYNSNGGIPLVIFLHGRSLCGTNLNSVRRYGSIAAIERGVPVGAYIVAPQNPGGAWSPKKIMDVVDWCEQNYNIDHNRVYVLGMSLGGYGTIDLATSYPDRIAAAMGLCGGGTMKDYTPLNEVPMWIAHGTADHKVPISASDKVVEAVRKTGPANRLLYDRLPGTDHGPLARLFYINQTYDWLFSHSLADPGRPVNRNYTITNETLKSAYSTLPGKRDVKIEQ